MAEASVEVPAGLVARVRDSVVLLYAAAAEGLHLALRAHGEQDGPGGEVLLQRERVARLDALLARMGWWAGRTAGGAVELTAPAEVLQDALYGALIDAGERLALACGETWRGDGGPEEVRQAAEEVIALDRLIGEVRGGPPG